MREEPGLPVDVGAALDEHVFEVLPGRFVRIVPFACRLPAGAGEEVTLSPEHREARWMPLSGLGATIAGYRLPAGYLGAIRQAADQRPSA